MTTRIIIDDGLSKKFRPGWEKEMLAHGDVLNRRGAFLMDSKGIHDALDSELEIEFRCSTGSAEMFVKALEQPSKNQGGLKSREERIRDFEARNLTMPCETHRRIKCADCLVP